MVITILSTKTKLMEHFISAFGALKHHKHYISFFLYNCQFTLYCSYADSVMCAMYITLCAAIWYNHLFGDGWKAPLQLPGNDSKYRQPIRFGLLAYFIPLFVLFIMYRTDELQSQGYSYNHAVIFVFIYFIINVSVMIFVLRKRK